MKTGKRGTCLKHSLLIALLLSVPVCYAAAAEEEASVISYIMSLPSPGAPQIFENTIIFTYTSQCRRAGVAFAHEGFSQVHWLRKMLVPADPLTALVPAGKKNPNPYTDSGILFYTCPIPEGVTELDYRMIIDGLWTIDPANPISRRNSASGIEYSVLPLPVQEKKPEILKGPPGTLNFSFQGPPGETVTVAGSFNGWDPFMYEMKEVSAGNYNFTLPLPPGRYQYIFFCRGERWLDLFNPNRAYSRDGIAVSEVVLQ